MAQEWRFDGFPGRVLWVDLSSRNCESRDIPHQWLLESMGGKGLATRLLVEWDTTDYEAAMQNKHPVSGLPDPASHPSTPLLFMTGPYQGTKIGSTGRAVVCGRSPLTNVFIDTYIGGNIGHELRRAGYDGIFFTGASQELLRLEIVDGDAQLHDASDLKGKTTWQVEQELQGLGECLSIGPAGEAGVRIASPITDGRRAAGRGGTGAAFGFKGIKAFTVKASAEAKQMARLADDFTLNTAVKKQRGEMATRRKVGDPFYSFGTSRGTIYASENCRMPTGNYSSTNGQIPVLEQLAVAGAKGASPGQPLEVMIDLDSRVLSGEHWHESLPDAKQSSCCTPCPIACEAADRPDGIKGKPKHMDRVDRPEYETLAMMGANLGITSSLDVMDANDACNRLGIDTISGGAALSLICEVAMRGWLPSDWPDHFHAPFDFGRFKQGDLVPWEFAIPELPPLALAHLASAQIGDGSLFGTLAAGAAFAAEWMARETGHPITHLTAHCKGLDLPAWDPRGKRGNAMAYMTANIGATHMRAGYKNPTGLPNEPAVDLMPELIESQNSGVIRDSMILCAFAKGVTSDEVMLDAWNALTGEGASWEDLVARGAKQWDLARSWNIEHWQRMSLSPREEDHLSMRLRKEALPHGIATGMTSFVSDEDEQACLSEYYRLRGWNDEGIPQNN